MKTLRVTVDGRAFDVTVEILGESPSRPAPFAAPPAAPASGPAASAPPPAGPGAVPSPLAGKVVSLAVRPGESVAAGATLLTLEAMKMNTFVYAPAAGRVAAVHVRPGDTVEEGAPLVTLA